MADNSIPHQAGIDTNATAPAGAATGSAPAAPDFNADRQALEALATETKYNIERAAALFEHIAMLAAAIDNAMYHGAGSIDEADAKSIDAVEIERLSIDVQTFIRGSVCRMGWMADLGHMKLRGCESVRGNAEDWLLPPTYHHIGSRPA